MFPFTMSDVVRHLESSASRLLTMTVWHLLSSSQYTLHHAKTHTHTTGSDQQLLLNAHSVMRPLMLMRHSTNHDGICIHQV